jgi:hypothetical protein
MVAGTVAAAGSVNVSVSGDVRLYPDAAGIVMVRTLAEVRTNVSVDRTTASNPAAWCGVEAKPARSVVALSAALNA